MKATEKKEMKTLSECMNSLSRDGFTENFMVKKDGLHALDAKRIYKPDTVKIVSFYRFEGESDPNDNSILYAVETNDGLKGLLSDAYGSYADPLISKYIAQVEEISKRETRTSGKKDENEVGKEGGSERQSDNETWKFE
jgi:hypothetical protein